MSARELMNGGGLASVGRQNGAMSEAQREFVKEREEGYAEMSDVWADEDDIRSARERTTNRRHVQFSGDGGAGLEMEHEEMRMDTSVPLASEFWDDDFDAAMISGGHAANVPKSKEADLSAQQKEWDTLQNDWDNFEATATGIQPVASTSSAFNGYTFAQNNPYVQSSTRTHELHHTPRTTYDSILEKEAAVQQNPRDSQAWLALGIKQQENEREEMAIRALRRALELDPGMGEAYLALAVSYTNENERSLSYEAIDKWINSLAVERYPREVEHYRDLFGPMPESGMAERSNYLTGLLIRLAQSSAERDGADVDADVQIGLGVLFNTSEEYDKAGDCFESALSVRPDVSLSFWGEARSLIVSRDTGSFALQPTRRDARQQRQDGARNPILSRGARDPAGIRASSLQPCRRQYEPQRALCLPLCDAFADFVLSLSAILGGGRASPYGAFDSGRRLSASTCVPWPARWLWWLLTPVVPQKAVPRVPTARTASQAKRSGIRSTSLSSCASLLTPFSSPLLTSYAPQDAAKRPRSLHERSQPQRLPQRVPQRLLKFSPRSIPTLVASFVPLAYSYPVLPF